MRAIELFSGVGGFRIGLERVGHQVIWANEWDKFACDVYDYNFRAGRIVRGDIRAIDAASIPAHDLIVGGFPCQAFSVAGKRRGFEDTRGTLFYEIARIAAYHRTPYLLLENVKGLLSHDEGRTFGTILKALDDLGYDVQWQVINSKDHGVPQNRERVILICNLRKRPRPEVFPLVGIGAADTVGKTLRAHSGGFSEYDTFIRRAGQVRRLTPVECERLQAFPDNWTKFGMRPDGAKYPMSDTQRYKQMGNAVTTNVIEAVSRRLPMEA